MNLDDRIPFFQQLVVVNEDLIDPPGDFRRNVRNMTINESVIRRLIARRLGKEVQTTDRQNQNQTDSKQGTLKALAGRLTQRRPATIVPSVVADLFSRLPKFNFQLLSHNHHNSTT